MKLEVGMFIRTKKGSIAKLLEFKKNYTKGKRKMSERIEDVLDLIKEYEVNECIFWQFKCRSIS